MSWFQNTAVIYPFFLLVDASLVDYFESRYALLQCFHSKLCWDRTIWGTTGTVVPSVTRIRYFKLYYQYGLGHEISLRLEQWRKLSSKDMSVKIIFNIVRYPDVIIWELRKERQFGFL
jgi:hypothetical protein